MDSALDLASLRRALEGAGCIAADEEAVELIEAASDERELGHMLQRRVTGEPLAWITGRVRFCGLDLIIEPGVYVPRWQSEPLAVMAAQLLPPTGRGVDLCTGSGAIAKVMQSAHPDAEVVTTEMDPVAAGCARRNGLVVYQGDLDHPLPARLVSRVDVLSGVLPYVPVDAMHLLPRDVRQFEPRRALNGGEEGLELIARVVRRSPRWLRPGGWLLLELGGDQVAKVTALLQVWRFGDIGVLEDDDGDPRGISARLESASSASR